MGRGTRALAVLAVTTLLLAQVGPSLAANQTRQSQGVDSRGEVEAFVDAAMAEDLQEHHVSGATVSVVKDGELLFAEGYGYADRRNRTPVVANRTLFRVGSVSKLFVWTAAMQQVEAGTLDPNADVNRYLEDVRIPRRYGRPVTLNHLATHTAGFEDKYRGTFVADPADVRPLGEALQNPPKRVRPPGVVTSYSNYGAALAGYIAAERANTTFDRYVENRIFAPLEMRHSTFRQPVPERVPGQLSQGYRFSGGRFHRGEFETVGIPPAGSMSATATDMANFMVAHLQEGRYGDERILGAAATRAMHRQQFTNHPAVNGMCFGFYEQSRNGRRIVGHGGDTELFHSGLWLFTERDLGVFVSYNSVGGAAAREEFIDSFVDRFFPREESPASGEVAVGDGEQVAADGSGGGETTDPATGLSKFTGTYRPTRVPASTMEKIGALFTDFRVRAAGGGTLVTTSATGQTRRWVRVAPTVFEEVGGDERLALRVEDGRTTYAFFDSSPPTGFARIPVYESTLFQLGSFGATGLVFLTAILGWPALALRRRWRGNTRTIAGTDATEGPRAARWLAGFAGALGLAFVAGLGYSLVTDPLGLLVGLSPATTALLAVPLLVGVATLGVVVFAGVAWWRRYWGVVGRLHYTLLAVALVVFCWQLAYWNLFWGWL